VLSEVFVEKLHILGTEKSACLWYSELTTPLFVKVGT